MKLERAFSLHTAPEGLRREEGRQLLLCLFWFFFCRERKGRKGVYFGLGGEALFCFFLMQMKKGGEKPRRMCEAGLGISVTVQAGEGKIVVW